MRFSSLKTVFLLLMISQITSIWGQKKVESEVYTVNVDQKIITASINRKRPITFVLKHAETSEIHTSVYSVKGYYYDEFMQDKPVSLVGIYGGDNTLTLYHFFDESFDDTLLDMSYQHPDFWTTVDHYKNMGYYTEKFVFEDNIDSIAGYYYIADSIWQPVAFNDYTVSILDSKEYLKFPNKEKASESEFIELTNLGYLYRNYKVVSVQHSKENTRVLLEFKYPSRHYLLGYCGSGQEYGLVYLELDVDGLIVTRKDILMESCLRDVGYENLSNRKQWKYRVVDHFTDHELVRELTINKTNLEFNLVEVN